MADIKNYDFSYVDACLLKRLKDKIQSVRFVQRPLNTYIIEDAYCLPLKMVLNDKEFCIGSICHKDGTIYDEVKILPDRLYEGYKFNPQTAIYDNREVIYAGAFWPHWGHFILEQISRLYYFLNETDSSLPIIYVSPTPLQDNYLEFFELFGIDKNRLIHVSAITQFKKIIVPEVSMVAMDYYTNEYKQIFKQVTSVVPRNENYPQKIFLTTSAFIKSPYKDFGELKEIEQMFEKSGYKIISPEQFSLKEQISYIKSCKKIVAIAGTLPHNFLFADKQVDATILNKSYVLNAHQWLINEATGIYPKVVDAHISILPAHIGCGPFYFHISDNLIKYAADNNIQMVEANTKQHIREFYKIYIPSIIRTKQWQFLLKTDFSNLNIFKYYMHKNKPTICLWESLFINPHYPQILLPVAIVLYLKNKVPPFIRQCFLVLSIKFHKFVWLNIKS